MEVTGTLKAKFDTQKVSDRFQKREFVLTTEANTPYPQHVSFQVTQDKCTILDQYNVGEELKVQFNHRIRLPTQSTDGDHITCCSFTFKFCGWIMCYFINI